MTNKNKLNLYLKKLINEVLTENEDVADLGKILANPDPERAIDYGSMEAYEKMLMQKIDRIDSLKDLEDLLKLLRNSDKSRSADYGSVVKYKAMLQAKINRLKAKLFEIEQSKNNPELLILVSTIGGTTIAIWKNAERKQNPDSGSDAHFKTQTPFSYIMNTIDDLNGSVSEKKVKSILQHLSKEERLNLKNQNRVITRNIPLSAVGL